MFTSKISSSSHGALRSLSLTMKSNLIPLVNIYEKYSEKQPSIFGMNKPIILQSSISSNPNPKAESFSWSVISETPLNLYLHNQSSISIKHTELVPGSFYKLELKIKFSNNSTGSYTYEFTINTPPVIERVSIYPKVGHELDTLFKISGQNSYDIDENYPLKYAFGYYQESKKVFLNIKNCSYFY